MKEKLAETKQQIRNLDNEVYFLMTGVENAEEIKKDYEKKVT